MNKIKILKNTIQSYSWGSMEFISQLLNRTSSSAVPEAELWMGAHSRAPSYVILGPEGESTFPHISLIDYINTNPSGILGAYTASRFNKTLPFLLKVLAAEKPLSIQAHPDKNQAEQGFNNENKKGIPLDARHRVYKDNNHKPEIICALTPFIALNGFRPVNDIITSLKSVKSTILEETSRHLQNIPDHKGLKQFFQEIMSLPESKKKTVIADILTFANLKTDDDPRKKWIIFLNNEYPGDIGIISMFLLHFITLNPGEAMFLPACQLHSYIHGAGIELMANSDNVLRGGLTPKYIDIPELLKIINFSESAITIIRPEPDNQHEKIYTTPSEEFILSSITLDKNTVYTSKTKRSIEILLCIEGNAMITELPTEENLSVTQGMAFLVPANLIQYRIHGSARLFKATVPLPD